MLAIPMLGPTELLLTLFIALLVFGNRLPSVMRNLGSSVNEFKKGLNEASEAPVAAPVPPVQAPLAAPQQVVTKQLP